MLGDAAGIEPDHGPVLRVEVVSALQHVGGGDLAAARKPPPLPPPPGEPTGDSRQHCGAHHQELVLHRPPPVLERCRAAPRRGRLFEHCGLLLPGTRVRETSAAGTSDATMKRPF
jgi:hypothetical protein